MSELVKIVDSLENKVSKLLHKLEMLSETNTRLENELDFIKNDRATDQKKISEWEARYDSLKMANSMLGSNSNKTEAKLKINTLIRELDQCIAQLAE